MSRGLFRRVLLPGCLVVVGMLLAAPAAAQEAVPEGCTALFNGRDLAGWQGLVLDPPRRAGLDAAERVRLQAEADARMRAHWTVQDGVLAFDGQGENLCTVAEYGDFELYVDWKIPPGGDSGIYLRGAPQVQIWDNPLGSGGLYNNQRHASRPLIVADRPPGEWNTFRIRMVGERVTVYLNGLLVVDDTPLENYWERGRPIYPRGPIELQSHGGPLWFRRLYIRELAPPASPPPAQVLRRGDRVAILGDSITEQRLYSRFVEDYLLACVPQLELSVVQLGWSGETAPGCAARLENDLLPLAPDVVTTCYGMNDGRYRPYEPAIGAEYAAGMRAIIERVTAAGALVVVGAPGAVDTDTFRRPDLPAAVYNENLARLRDVARELAHAAGQPFANVHDHMVLAMRRAKPVLGPDYHVCGGDGFHPAPNGHIVMAYALLKALGVDGEIGTITLEWGGPATATDGHRVIASRDGTLELESARYPFCFAGDAATPDSTRSIVPFVPFNADLNRFVLVVTNLPAPAATVTWGSPKRFSREQLAAGINLAAEFSDHPLAEPFRRLDEIVARKQAYETRMIKQCIHSFLHFRDLLGGDAEAAAALEALRARLQARQAELAAEARAAVGPVRHTLVIRPEE